jgi:hypothetical protein
MNTQVEIEHISFRKRANSIAKQFENIDSKLGFDVLTAVTMKMAVFCVVAPCWLIRAYHRFGRHYCLHHQCGQ